MALSAANTEADEPGPRFGLVDAAAASLGAPVAAATAMGGATVGAAAATATLGATVGAVAVTVVATGGAAAAMALGVVAGGATIATAVGDSPGVTSTFGVGGMSELSFATAT